jgi:hypothetical protein
LERTPSPLHGASSSTRSADLAAFACILPITKLRIFSNAPLKKENIQLVNCLQNHHLSGGLPSFTGDAYQGQSPMSRTANAYQKAIYMT